MPNFPRFRKGFYNDVLIIAEVKIWSPRGKRLTDQSFKDRVRFAGRVGSCVSILTHPIWKGEKDHTLLAREILPPEVKILAKDFHPTDDEARRAIERYKATFALVVGRIPQGWTPHYIIEPLDFEEFRQIPDHRRVAWNSRQLATLKDLPGIPEFILERWEKMGARALQEKEPFREARACYRDWLCQASNVKTVADIDLRADAVLVGTHLDSFAASLGITP